MLSFIVSVIGGFCGFIFCQYICSLYQPSRLQENQAFKKIISQKIDEKAIKLVGSRKGVFTKLYIDNVFIGEFEVLTDKEFIDYKGSTTYQVDNRELRIKARKIDDI